MKAFFLNIISGLKKFFLSRGFKKFISREFLILLLGGAIVAGASLYKEYDKNSIRKYNATLNYEINKQIDSLNSLNVKEFDEKKLFAFYVYDYLDDRVDIADKENKERIEDIDYYGYKQSRYQWVLNPVKEETYNSFLNKFSKRTRIYYRGFGTQEYPLHVYNAMAHWDNKFKNKYTYKMFISLVKKDGQDLRRLNAEIRNENSRISKEIKRLNSEKLTEKSSVLPSYFVEDVTFYVLIIFYGLRLLLYLIISSIRVLRKG